jgi:hypothetical protein
MIAAQLQQRIPSLRMQMSLEARALGILYNWIVYAHVSNTENAPKLRYSNLNPVFLLRRTEQLPTSLAQSYTALLDIYPSVPRRGRRDRLLLNGN